MRIDKWLWAVRIYKTRSIAANECRKGRVSIDGQAAKPSRELVPGLIVCVRKPPVSFSYQVLGLPANRLPAKLVPGYCTNITPQEELDKLALQKEASAGIRPHSPGRPTKKNRRQLGRLYDE